MKSNKKSALRAGLLFGVYMGLFFGLLLVPCAGCFGARFESVVGIVIGLVIGVFLAVLAGGLSGLIYGLMMYSFMEKKAKEFAPLRESLIAQRRLYYDDGANHFVGAEGVGGWLFLLNDSLYFKSHQQNIQVHELQIPLVNIRKVESCKKLGMNTGLNVELVDGRVEKYTVNEPQVWAKKIYEGQQRILQSRA